MTGSTQLLVKRSAIGDTTLRHAPAAPLADGRVRVRVDGVAITANTITYATFGDVLGYWSFYPTAPGDDQWGLVPAVGWGTVVESTVGGIEVGSHVHGWLPMATSVDIEASPTADGFRDDGAHRTGHAPIYRAFVASDRDPMHTAADRQPDREERRALVGVLYLTGYLVEAFFEGERFAGVEQSIVMSASSKTAIGYAFATRQARAAGKHVPLLVGVTSAGNVGFVRELGLYDDVLTYSDIDSVALRPSVIVDMAGAGSAVAAVHRRLGDLIAHSMIIGKSHHHDPGAVIEGGPQPALFFAPTEAERLIAEAGLEGYRHRLAVGLTEFIGDTHRWLEIERHHGPDAFIGAWARVFSGDVPPNVGVIASMHC